MKVLVAVKSVPDPNAYIPLGEDGQLDLRGVRRVVNPWDEVALDLAAARKAAGDVSEIVAVSVAPESEADGAEAVLRAALARAADRAILVTTGDGEDRPEAIAPRLAVTFTRELPSLIVCGNLSSDADDGQTGPRLAGLFGWPLLGNVREWSVADGMVSAVRDVTAGRETIRVRLPAVVTVDLANRSARPIPLPLILKAKGKPLERYAADALPAPLPTAVLVVRPTPPRPPCQMVSDVGELLHALAERSGGATSSPSSPWFPASALVGVEGEADLLAWVAGRKGWSVVRGVVDGWDEDGWYCYRRGVHAGRFQETVTVPKGKTHVVTVAGEGRRTDAHRQQIVEALAGAEALSGESVSLDPTPAGDPDLASARVVVTGGRGLRDRETFEQLVGGLAAALGGAVAASGGASNTEIAPAKIVIGQSGKTVAPELYIALGISGADQHVAGFRDAKTVVAINSDRDAPIFRFADIGLVADLREAVPEWIARVRK